MTEPDVMTMKPVSSERTV
ncbi:hypothetical protein LEMLEM_LOCUS9143 [Lemmus lemmus]